MFAATLLVVFTFPALIRAAPQVQIGQGTLSGTLLKSRNGHEFYAFYGIPYAQPPTGELRFQPPRLPPPSWQGIRNAAQDPPFCPQAPDAHFKGNHPESEDCLYLQVFTHNINVTDQHGVPVLVFFHGGAFKEGGSTLYDPSFFMDKPIVVVTVNSRLGVFGYFSTGDASYPGNYGLKDQTAALQWIQKNIRSFGGDPSTVTIMGHSSGAASVHCHTLSPLSKGIFHRAIIHSGTANMIWSITPTERAKRNFQRFKQHTNCLRPSTKESVSCLLTIPFKKLSNLASTYPDVDSRPFVFNPVIEPFGDEGAFLPTDPFQYAYLDSQIPIIFGFTSNEILALGALRNGINCTDEKAFNAELLQRVLLYKPTPNGDEELIEKTTALVKRFYFANNFANCNRKTTTILRSDHNFKFGILDAIKTYSNRSFAFEYDYKDSSPFPKDLGVGHGAELRMLFPIARFNFFTPEEKQVSETMITYWSNFIVTGNPNTPNRKVPSEWSPAKNGEDEYLRIMRINNTGFQMEKESIREQMDLWNYYTRIFWK